MSSLTDLRSNAKKKKKRVGRGNGSGHGTFSCKGMKGQTARSGGRRRPGFEGGQTPYIQKLPKLKGFKNPNHIDYQVINLSSLNIFDDKATVDIAALLKKNLISKKTRPVKLLAQGTLEKSLTVIVHKASIKAAEAIKAQNGTLQLIEKTATEQ